MRVLTTLATFTFSFIPAPCIGTNLWSGLTPIVDNVVPTKNHTIPPAVLPFNVDLTAACNLYAGGSQNVFRAYFYCNLLNNISQCWAIYCLVLLYHVVHTDLHAWRPLPKFLVIKAVVFFSFWQSTLIQAFFVLVVRDEWVQSFCSKDSVLCILDKNSLKDVICDGLIVIEMLIYSLAHHWIFSWKQFRRKKADGTRQKMFFEAVTDPTVYRSLVDAAIPVDMYNDVKESTNVAANQLMDNVHGVESFVHSRAEEVLSSVENAIDDISLPGTKKKKKNPNPNNL